MDLDVSFFLTPAYNNSIANANTAMLSTKTRVSTAVRIENEAFHQVLDLLIANAYDKCVAEAKRYLR